MSKFYTHFALRGNNVLYVGRENGKKIIKRVPYKPSLFVPSKKSTEYISFDHKIWLDRIQFDSITDARDYVERYSDVDGYSIHGMQSYDYAYISDEFPDSVDYDLSQIKVMYFDIETTCETGFPSLETFDQTVIAITCLIQNQFVCFGLGDYTPTLHNVEYRKFESERDLLIGFVEYIKCESPDVISGYNITFFDIPYLVGRMDRVVEPDYAQNISPWKSMKSRIMTIQGKTYTAHDFLGIVSLDYMEVYKKFRLKKLENYKLQTLAEAELNESKVKFEGNFKTLYTTDYQKFIDYNIQDVRIVAKLEEKLKLMEMIFSIAYNAKCNYMDVFKQVRLWDTIIFNHLKKYKMIIPPKKEEDKDSQYEGAAVKEPLVGLHKWIASFDVNSLYPMLIVQYNISPEKLISSEKLSVTVDQLLQQNANLKHLKSKDWSMAANGHYFLRDSQGFLPKILERMYEDRKSFKKDMLKYKNELERVKQELRSRGIDC